jgi:WD40 repeat protein/GTPase SAR1 family protein
MSNTFEYDVFLSYSFKDAFIARKLAERLRDDGLHVWFDEHALHHEGGRTSEPKDALVRSRALVLIISFNALGTEWGELEAETLLFRDPTDDQRRFIPLVIDSCPIPETIRRYKLINWLERSNESYQELLEVCKPSTVHPVTPAPSIDILDCKLKGHRGWVWSMTVISDKLVLSGSEDGSLKVWDIESGTCLATYRGHLDYVCSVAVSQNNERALSGSGDHTLKLWNLISGECITTFENHTADVLSVAMTPDGKRAISSSNDGTIKIWNLDLGWYVSALEGHTEVVNAVAITPDGKQVISASRDNTLMLWNLDSRKCVTIFKGHTSAVISVAVTLDGKRALSGSRDTTLKLWDLQSGACLATFEGHQQAIREVAISSDGLLAASTSHDRMIKIWLLKTGACLQTLREDHDFHSLAFTPDNSRLLVGADNGDIYVYQLKNIAAEASVINAKPEVRYTNAKVVLVGKSGVGKSGLGYRLAEDRWVITDSTHGMRIWPLQLPSTLQQPDIEREIWLWDLAGQPEYRLIHQLFLDETALALVVFNPQAEDPFEGLGDWENALRMAIGENPVKLLVAARIDRGGAALTLDKIERFCRERDFSEYFATSAKLDNDKGCDDLKQALTRYIPWEQLPWTSTTQLFKTLKDTIVRLKDEGIVLIRVSELRQRLQMLLVDESFKEEDLRTVVSLLAGQGLVKRLDFGDFVLLQPEQLNNYAAAVIRIARENIDGIGCISEQAVLKGEFDFKDMPRLSNADEEILLRAMVQTFLDQSLCIREETPFGVQLVFPSQFNRELEIPTHPRVFVSYRFAGNLPTVYTTLIVRLNYSDSFEKKDLWKNAAEFYTPEGKIVGLLMKRIDEGIGEIKIFFDAGVPDDTRVTFIKYVHQHLLKRSNNVEREREYFCPNCNELVEDRKAIKKRLEAGRTDIGCGYCDTRILLLDLIEEKFNEDRFLKIAHEIDIQAGINLDNESRELILVGQAFAIAGEAGQIYRGYTNSDHGIDGEIEFKDNQGRASGKKIYLQLKSGDSYIYERRSDRQEIFTVKKDRHLEYWQSQAYPVYLVIRTSDGVIRWMNVTEYLKERTNKASRQIVFDGEQFTAFTLMSLRSTYISPSV